MKKSEVKVGIIVEAKSEEELKHRFQGKVEKIYENSALLSITAYDPEDEASVSDLNHKMVINFKHLKKISTPKQAHVETPNDVKVEKKTTD